MFLSNKLNHNNQSFTLIELLVVIAILAVLMSVVVIAINPTEMLKKTRDTKRVSDFDNLRTALNLYQSEIASFPFSVCDGTKIYVSLPSNNSNCSDLNLSSLPSGYTYQCSTIDNYRKINGTGWIPLNLASISVGSPLSTLPIDPKNTNTDSLYYTFYCNQDEYILTTYVEAQSNGPKGGLNALTIQDGGPDPYLYELGTSLFISPLKPVGSWSFEEGSGTTAYDSSGNNNHGTLKNGPTWTTGQVNGALNFDGVDDFVSIGTGTNYFPMSKFTLCAWIKPSEIGTASTRRGIIGITNGLNLYLNTDGYLYLGINSDSSTDTINRFSSFQNVLDNKSHYVCANYDGTNVNFFIDGALKKTQATTWSGTTHWPTSAATIGWEINNPSWKFNGLIDEPRVYNRALSAEEINRHYEESK